VKDENKQTVLLAEAILFDHQLIQRITFDLVHINQGWDDEKHNYAQRNRSSYSSDDIVDFFEQFKYFSIQWILGVNKEDIKIKGVPHYRYYWETTDEKGDIVRVVLDVPYKITGEGIIVTVFKP
jgi:hypothetical protein